MQGAAGSSSGTAVPVADRPAVSWGAAMAAAIDAAGSATAGGGAASIPAPAPSILQGVMQQELKQQQGAATANRSASGGSSVGTWAAAEAAQQQRQQQQQQGSQGSSKPVGADLAKMALVQVGARVAVLSTHLTPAVMAAWLGLFLLKDACCRLRAAGLFQLCQSCRFGLSQAC